MRRFSTPTAFPHTLIIASVKFSENFFTESEASREKLVPECILNWQTMKLGNRRTWQKNRLRVNIATKYQGLSPDCFFFYTNNSWNLLRCAFIQRYMLAVAFIVKQRQSLYVAEPRWIRSPTSYPIRTFLILPDLNPICTERRISKKRR